MSKYYLFQDVKNCIDCRSCEVACKSNKNLPPGPRLCEIIAVGPSLIGDLPRAAYTFMPCFHCEDPWCVAACPTGAMQKRQKGRHCLCGSFSLCGVQNLYVSVSVGCPPVE